MVCGFIIRKPHKLHSLYILIYLIIFNIKYIINSLITLVFQKKKFDNPSKCWLRKPTQNKEKLDQNLKLGPKQREKLVLG